MGFGHKVYKSCNSRLPTMLAALEDLGGGKMIALD